MTTIDDTTPVHLQGNGRPTAEEHSIDNLTVRGSIPTELDGRYIRNGANPLSGTSDHPFFGDGMVHGMRLRDGNAEWYRNRYVRTPFITDPSIDILDPSVMMDMTASKANTHVFGHAGRILALEEGHFPYVIDGELDTVGPLDFGGKLTGSFTAHPKICPITGEMLAFGYSPIAPYFRYLRVSADGELVQSEEITVGGPTMMHDFNVTRNHIVIMDLPAVFDMEMAMRGEMPIHWDDNYPARLGVMPRNGTDADVRWYDIDPGYVFHPMNAYEDGDTIVLDVARLTPRVARLDDGLPVARAVALDDRHHHRHRARGPDRRSSGRVPACRRLRHRPEAPLRLHVGASADQTADPKGQTGTILKYDRERARSSELGVGQGCMPGEPVFVPAEGGTNEDDGYLMTYVYDADQDSSRFVVLDAATMDSEPIASIELPAHPVRVPRQLDPLVDRRLIGAGAHAPSLLPPARAIPCRWATRSASWPWPAGTRRRR